MGTRRHRNRYPCASASLLDAAGGELAAERARRRPRAPPASSPPRRAAGRSSACRTGRARRCPTIACSGTPAWRARVPISPTSLPSSVCSSSLPSPVTTAREARMRCVEVQRVQHPRRARLQRGAVRRPQPAGEAAGAAGHGDAAWVARERGGERVEPSLEPGDHRRVGALLRAEHLRRVLERGADVAQHDEAGRRAGRRRPRSPPARRRRRRRWPSRRRRRGSPARRPARRRRSARRCRWWTPPTRRARPRRPGRGRWPTPSRRSRCRRPRPARTRPGSGRPSGSCTSTPTSSPPSCGSSASSVPSPPSATGHRSGGISPARSSPRPIAPATSDARKVPLNESGATRTGRSATGAIGRIVASA